MSQLNVDTIKKADGTGSLTVPAESGTVVTTASPSLGRRNLIINGAMQVAQRGTSAITANGNNQFPVDRFAVQQVGVGGSFTAQQSSTAPEGHSKSLVITVTGTGTPSGSDRAMIAQFIEGLNSAHLNWGTANAKTVTFSFWVRSSVTGTFGGSITNNDVTPSYPFTYSISSADTWEQKTITIEGPTTGTWLATNGVGVRVYFGISVGPDKSGTSGAWASADYRSATGATNLLATNGATFYITGVQLEVGSVATPFEHRSYGEELALCQRYYTKYKQDYFYSSDSVIAIGCYNDPDDSVFLINLPVTLRGTPTMGYNGLSVSYTGNQNMEETSGVTVQTLMAVSNNTVFITVDHAGGGSSTAVHLLGLGAENASHYLDLDCEL